MASSNLNGETKGRSVVSFRDLIVEQARVYGTTTLFKELQGKQEFRPGEDYLPPSGKVIGGSELGNAVAAVLEGWLTEGHWVDQFERGLAKYLGVRCASMVNSGSSANLLAVAVLRSSLLKRSSRFAIPQNRTEIITAATGFPTTLNPILQYGFTPVLVDVQLGTYVPDTSEIMAAVTDRTAAIFLAHTLGNPVPLTSDVLRFCERHQIAILEDNCDALGSIYLGRRTGTLGLAATHSFYPAHHMTTGEGGAIVTRHPLIRRIVESLRDWGRDCWCEPGKENTCGKRFDWEFDGLPTNYDHKYVYSSIGYNLKSTDIQAAIGVAQLDRLDGFAKDRAQNFAFLHRHLKPHEEFFHLPQATVDSQPNWFGFPLTVREGAPFTRPEIIEYLNACKIGTRNLFGGNLMRQPAYRDVFFRVPGTLTHSDIIAGNSFWIGVHPGLTRTHMEFMAEMLDGFARQF